MSSLVSDFLITPVLRQARRLSEISRSTVTGDGDEPSTVPPDEAISEAGPAMSPAPEPEPETVVVAEADAPHSRPLSSSTQDTRVGEEVVTVSPMATEATTRDSLGFPLSPSRSRQIPEDDGMRALRTRIHAINAQELSSAEKAKLMHGTLMEGYLASRAAGHTKSAAFTPGSPLGQGWEPSASPATPEPFKFWHGQLGETSTQDNFVLIDSDIAPTYAPIRHRKTSSDGSSPPSPPDTEPPLGCHHYERNVKLQCFTCQKWYTCRFCHDAKEDHSLIRLETKNMLCMLCGTPQRASEVCISCGEISAQYYCNICKLWENRKSKPIYHCNDCGICRRGLGLGKDFFHCKTCNACITTSIRSSHKCIERSTDCDCPICGEYMFTSPRPVVFMTCGHSIHKKCYDQHMRVSYKCPLCNKSLANMETQFRNLDVAVQSQPMPPEFRDTKAVILCNDCSAKSTVSYHWLGLKCSICRSYNTVEIQMLGGDSEELQAAVAQRAAAINETISQNTAGGSAQPTAIPPGSSSTNAIPNRRRHSSYGAELQHRFPDRIARSLSPLAIGDDALTMHMIADEDSDDEMLGFWRSNGEDDDDSSYLDESDSDGASDALDLDDDEDDEDEPIVLIGHR